MPQLFSKRNISDAENRLRLLLCIQELGPASKEQLWPFVAGQELMDYIPMCLYVDDLIRDGSLSVLSAGPRVLRGALCLTDEGRHTLELFVKRMAQEDAARIRQAAPAYKAALAERRQLRAVYELASPGKYRAACSVTEGDVPTLFLRMETGSKRLAAGAVKRFRVRASRLLTSLYTLPPLASSSPAALEGRDDLETALRDAAPDRPLVCGFGKREQAAVVCLKNQRVELRLALLLPSPQYAEEWVAAVQADPQTMLNRVCALLTEKEPST